MIRLSGVLILLFITLYSFGEKSSICIGNPEEDIPVKIQFDYGQNVLDMGTSKVRVDLTEIGANAFDN